MTISYTAALRAPMLEVEHERMLIENWQARGHKASLQTLIVSHARQVHACVRRINSKREHQEDLVAEGLIGLIKAADRFEIEKDVRFSTYAYWWVMNSVRAANARLRAVVDVPLGAPQEEKQIYTPVFLNDEGEEVDLDERLPSDVPTPEEQVIAQSHSDEMRKTMADAMQDLSEIERDIVISRNLTADPEATEDLATRLGLGRDRLRQVERRAMSRLKFALMARGVSAASMAQA